MSIYLTHNSKMIKADSTRPGRYFGWIDNSGDLSGLLYLTYFTTDFMTDSTKYDTPVVRDQSIPLIQGASNAYLGTGSTGLLTADSGPRLPGGFVGYDCAKFDMNYVDDTKTYGDTVTCPWNLPFTSSDQFSVTYRAIFRTNKYVHVVYQAPDYLHDHDWYWLNPAMQLIGTSHNLGVSDFDSERYPSKILCSYGVSKTDDEPTTGVNLRNGTTWSEFIDRTYYNQMPGYDAEYPPFGRKFYSFQNPNVSPIIVDQWYYIVICGHGDGTMSIYVNGNRIITVPFEEIHSVEFYTGAKRFDAYVKELIGDGIPLEVTELSVWGKDLSLFDHTVVPNKLNPIYTKNGQGIYVPNGDY